MSTEQFKITEPGEYVTRGGIKAVVISTNGRYSGHPVVGYYGDSDVISYWKRNGVYLNTEVPVVSDIIGPWKDPPRRGTEVRYFNVYKNKLGTAHSSAHAAGLAMGDDAIGRVRVTFEWEEGRFDE